MAYSASLAPPLSEIDLGKIITAISKRRGPRTEPCGTPDNIGGEGEDWLLTTTFREWLVRLSVSQSNETPHALYVPCHGSMEIKPDCV